MTREEYGACCKQEAERRIRAMTRGDAEKAREAWRCYAEKVQSWEAMVDEEWDKRRGLLEGITGEMNEALVGEEKGPDEHLWVRVLGLAEMISSTVQTAWTSLTRMNGLSGKVAQKVTHAG